MSQFKIDVSTRILRLPPYLFGRINKMKYEKRVAGIDIIEFHQSRTVPVSLGAGLGI